MLFLSLSKSRDPDRLGETGIEKTKLVLHY